MKKLRSFVPALAGALVVLGMAGAPSSASAQLNGHVKSVDTAANTLIVTQTGTGTDYPIAVSGQTTVVTTSGKPITLKDLRQGDGLAVTQFNGLASNIVAAQARLTGLVKSVDVQAGKLVLRENGSKGEPGAGKDVTVRVDAQTPIAKLDGTAIKLGNLKEGDGLSIVHAGELAEKIDVNVKPDELTGFVKSVGADLKTFVVTLTGTKTDVTVAVNERTSIVTTEGKTLKFRDLKEGDGVGVAHTNSLASKIVVNVKAAR